MAEPAAASHAGGVSSCLRRTPHKGGRGWVAQRGTGRAERSPRQVVAAGRVGGARRSAAPEHARPAELLVRRGVRAGAHAAPVAGGDAALGRAPRKHAAAVVRADLGRGRGSSARGCSRCACPRRWRGSPRCRWRGGSGSSWPAAGRRSPPPRWWRPTRCSSGTRRRREPTVCSCSWRRSRCGAGCAPTPTPRRAG